MGDRKSLSGETKFWFEWTYLASSGVLKTGSSEITISLKKADAQPVSSILPMALQLLAARIMDSPKL
jgi:hypothetical protein